MRGHCDATTAREQHRGAGWHLLDRVPHVLAVMTLLLVGIGGSAPGALAEPQISPIYWSGAFSIDPGGEVSSISCASTTLCVAVDGTGKVAFATNPSGEPGAWNVVPVAGSAHAVQRGISCIPTPLCVAVGAGHLMTSIDPVGGSGAWTVEPIDDGAVLNSVSCVPPSLCVAVDARGRVLTTTEPAAGASAWKVADIDGEQGLGSVSCASASLCAVLDEQGNVLTATNPTAGPGAWKSTHIAAGPAKVSCVAAPFCVAMRGTEVLSSSNPTGGSGAWTGTQGPRAAGGVSCASSSLCVAFDSGTNSGVSVSANPGGGPSAWVEGGIGSRFVSGVSCTSSALCIAIVESGAAMVSTSAHVLSVSLLGTAKGRVTSTPIACPWTTCSHAPPGLIEPLPITAITCEDIIFSSPGGECSLGFPASNQVTLTPTPGAGSAFAGWGGACSGIGSCVVTMSSDQNVTATFHPPIIVCSALCPCSTGCSPSRVRLTALSETYSVFAVGGSSTPLSGQTAAKRHHRGTVFSFRLDRPATVKIAIQATASGRRVGRRCEREGRELRKKPRCTRTVTIAMLTRTGQDVRLNKVAFSGRIAGKALKAGHYRAVFTASDAAGRSLRQSLSFTIVKR